MNPWQELRRKLIVILPGGRPVRDDLRWCMHCGGRCGERPIALGAVEGHRAPGGMTATAGPPVVYCDKCFCEFAAEITELAAAVQSGQYLAYLQRVERAQSEDRPA